MLTRRLVVETPEGVRELLFVGRLVAGRAPECDISLADTKVSRQHAEFDGTGPVPHVRDLSSRNGILVNGHKVGGADLAVGDVVTVGDARIRLEEVAPRVVPPETRRTGERTAVFSPPQSPAPDAAAVPDAAPPPMPVPEPIAPVPAAVPVAPAAVPALAPPGDDRTVVLPPPSAPPAVVAGTPAEPHVTPPPASAVVPAAPAPPSPLPARGPALPRRAASGPAPVVVTDAPPVVAASPALAAAPASAQGTTAPRGTRMSWAGLITLACVVLAGSGVLLGAIPLMSAATTAMTSLSQRQARTLALWLASSVQAHPDDPAGTAVDTVLAQSGVVQALVLDAETGRVVAPTRLSSRVFTAPDSLGGRWSAVSGVRVEVAGEVADAVAPVAHRGRRLVAWVRYEVPGTGEAGLAVVVSVLLSLGLALLTALVIRRHTAKTLQHFTRQAELVVSGAPPATMQGQLAPGLERLPGVISYILEQQRHRRSGMGETAAAGSSAIAVSIAPAPAWLEVTPSLQVVKSSQSAPAVGARSWPPAPRAHLLDILEPGPLCHAVVQGLGGLGNAAGAEVSVPVAGQGAVLLRREASTNVRVELETR